MANVLGTLFTDIANAIRSKTGSTDKMAPIDFPSEIAKIVVGSGGSDSGLGNLKINSGSFRAEDNIYVRTIEHGLGVMPDMIIVRHEYFGEQSDGCITFIVGTHSRICNAFNISGNYYSSTNLTWTTPENTLDNVDESISVGRLFCRDDNTFEVGSLESSSNGFFSTYGTYYWIAISGMGGGSGGIPTGYHSVTFMNGDNVLFERLVLSGDDCPDPVTQGRIETPTKESTPQYNYTYSGWATTNGGTANSNVLKNITEDKVVYSAYTSTVRKYTITYYDEDGVTVLHTEQLGYGSVPNYMPTKDGFAFDKWTPTPVAVTGNASYTASWSSAIASGTCGDSITWSLSTDYIMSINGTGDMTNYVSETSRAWDTYKADITAVVISDGITSIGDYAFCGFKQITNIAIPNSVNYIGKFALYNCSGLTSITIPSTVTSIGNSAFQSCIGLTSITIPSTVASMGNYVFAYCSKLENVTILNGITSIGDYVFQMCFALTSITIPVSVTSIGNNAFQYCSKFANVYYAGSETDKSNITIGTNNDPLNNATWHYNYTN